MVKGTIETSAILLKKANDLEEENEKLKTELQHEQAKYVRDIEKMKNEQRLARD